MNLDILKDILSMQLDVDPEAITPETDLIEDLGIDSLDLIDLITAVEERLDIVITSEKVGTVRTVADVLEIIEEE